MSETAAGGAEGEEAQTTFKPEPKKRLFLGSRLPRTVWGLLGGKGLGV